MRRTLLAILVGALAAGGMTLADHGGHGKDHGNVKVISRTAITEKVDGKKSKATTVEVTLEPGRAGEPHRHPGPVFGYVLEGEYEWAIDDQPARVLKAGETFYEPAGCVHRVSKNPGKKGKTRVLAVVLHPEDARDIVLPVKAK